MKTVSSGTWRTWGGFCLWKPSSNDIETGLLKEKNSEKFGRTPLRFWQKWWKNSAWFACVRVHVWCAFWQCINIRLCLQSTWRSRFVRQARAVAFMAVARLEASGFWAVWLMASVSGDDCRVHESHRQRRKASAPIPYSNHHWYERARVGGHCFHYWSFQPTHDFHAFIFSFQLFCFLSRPCWIQKGGSASAQIFLSQMPRVSLTWYLKWLRFCCTESFYCFKPMLESELVIVGSSLSCGNRCICSRMAGDWHRFSLQILAQLTQKGKPQSHFSCPFTPKWKDFWHVFVSHSNRYCFQHVPLV